MKPINPLRIIVNKDIQQITGKSRKQAGRLLKDMKLYYKRTRKQVITLAEFCEYTGYKIEEVWALLN